MDAWKRAADQAYAAWAATHERLLRMRRAQLICPLSEVELKELARLQALEVLQFRHAARLRRAWEVRQALQAGSALLWGCARALVWNSRVLSRIEAPVQPLSRKEVDMKQFKHWESVVTALLGVWLMVSPWLLKFAEATVARDNAVLTGVVALVAGLWALSRENDWAIPSNNKRATS